MPIWSSPNGVYYSGGAAPSLTLTDGFGHNVTGVTGYTVRNYYGAVVSSGVVSGSFVTPTAPTSGWRLGWYRVYLTGPNMDSLFDNAYAPAANFVILRDDARFPVMPSTAPTYGGESQDPRTRGVLGLPAARLYISNTATPSTEISQWTLAIADIKAYWSSPTLAAYVDAARPSRRPYCLLQNSSVDYIDVPNSSSGGWLRFYVATEALDGSVIFIGLSAGSTSGAKITVYSPISTTVVETFDNLPASDPDAAAVLINASSTYVKVFRSHGLGGSAGIAGPTAVGRAQWNGVVEIVQAMYPDVKVFEGPMNEPLMTAETAHQMRLFSGAVHAGNASAKAIGPCPVETAGLDTFFAAGGGNWCDEISFHSYNIATNGNLAQGRQGMQSLKDTLTKYGLASKPLWETEATQAMKSVYGVYHPRRARIVPLLILLWEQYGVPRERNIVWYDHSHGFWSAPTWLFDLGPGPECAMVRVLAEETFGQNHSASLDFGPLGNRIILGSIYSGTSGSTAVLVLSSAMPGATATLGVLGASGALTVADAFGELSIVSIIGGRITVPVSELPTYVRLPVGATVSAYTFNGWPLASQNASSTSIAKSATLGGAATTKPVDGVWPSTYPSTDTTISSLSLPDSLTVAWNVVRADRVIIWCSPAWQAGSALIDFDIQTSSDGVTWTTQETVTRLTPFSFQYGNDDHGTGTQYETYWDEQWIFDVPFPGGPVTFKYLRLYARATSYGGEPDAQSVAAGGQGNSVQQLAIQEIAVLCDDNTNPQWVVT